MNGKRGSAAAGVAAMVLLFGAACSDGAQKPASLRQVADYAPAIDPAVFTTTIDNPYLPLAPGTVHTYEGTTDEGLERIVVEVTRETKTVMGVRCIVVRDTVTIAGELVEDTYDWYAQHRDGTVWYFGEKTAEYENGVVVNTDGAWEAGVDGAQPGVVMPAKPRVGETYRQEYYRGEAEDMADVLSVTEQAVVPAGSYSEVVMTRDYTPLSPELEEHKYYARGVGFVLEVATKGGSDRIGLVRTEHR